MELIPLMPYCPHCGCTLIFLEHYDCYDDADETLFFARGYCPECGQEYHWADVYKFSHIEGLTAD